MSVIHLRVDCVVRNVDDLHVAILRHGEEVRVERVPRGGGARARQRIEEQLRQLARVRHLVAGVARAVDDQHFMGQRTLFQIAGMPHCPVHHNQRRNGT